MLFVQALGRAMRLHPGVDDCILLDCAGCSHLGHPFDIHADELDDGTKPVSAARKKQQQDSGESKKCIKCDAVRQPKVRACWNCGFEPKMRPTVEELDNGLRQINRNGSPEAAKLEKENRQKWYSSLIAIRDANGYKHSWADVSFKNKFGVWPISANVRPIAAQMADPEVLAYVAKERRKFLMRKNRGWLTEKLK